MSCEGQHTRASHALEETLLECCGLFLSCPAQKKRFERISATLRWSLCALFLVPMECLHIE